MGKRSDSSESGTPDWLRKRREKGSTIPRDGEGKGGGKGKFKDGDKDGGKGGGKERRPGDWECPACGANNFARRSDCFKCGAQKDGGGGRGGGRDRSRSRGRR
mmetsp:Transcript_34668/g.80922  ORF Transcript_34668/g.80922 Transcript_34668/m.80922 type:complete len:103 (+) Transcript_34668:97-405(+)